MSDHGSRGTSRRLAPAVLALAFLIGCSPTPTSLTVASPGSSIAIEPRATIDISPSPASTPPVPIAIPSPVATARPETVAAVAALRAVPLVREVAVSPLPNGVDDRAWEPSVATHPTDPDRIAVVYQHRGPGAACRLNPVIRISGDGGKTWRSTRRSPAAGSGRSLDLHAVVAWGPGPSGGSRLYWADMTSPGCGDPRFSLSTAYSDDEGDSWSRVRVEHRTPPWVGGFPEITVDRDPASPGFGAVYVAYNWLAPGANGPGFRLLASADFGRTWATTEIPPAPSPRGYGDWWRIGYRLRTAPDGAVYASWYQVDLHRWDRTRIFAKGGTRNVGRLGVAVAQVRFDRPSRTFKVGPARIAATVAETAYTTAGASAPGTAGSVRPDPMWLHGLDVDRATGRIYLAIAAYGPAAHGSPRGTIRVGHSDDGGATWSFSLLPSATDTEGRARSSVKPDLVAGPGYVLVTFHTLDDVRSPATFGSAYTISIDSGASWRSQLPVSRARWRAADIGGVVNGAGLRERAASLADGNVFWAYGDARIGRGRTAVFGALIRVKVSR